MESDRKIPALKLFISQLDRARQPVVAADMLGVDTNLVGLVLLGVDFTRVWLQGIVVEVETLSRSFVVDDGTGTVTAVLPRVGLEDGANSAGGGADARNSGHADGLPRKGEHLLLVGAVESHSVGQQGQQRSSCGQYRVLCDVIKDLGAESPNRATLWGLEVVNFWRSLSHNSQG